MRDCEEMREQRGVVYTLKRNWSENGSLRYATSGRGMRYTQRPGYRKSKMIGGFEARQDLYLGC